MQLLQTDPPTTRRANSRAWNEPAEEHLDWLNGHPPVCGPNEATPEGYTWRDMPGREEEAKRWNFGLHRCGLLPLTPAKDGRLFSRKGHDNRRRSGRCA